MKKKIIFIALIFIAILSYKYIYQDHRNIANENSEFNISAEDLAKEFQVNPTQAEATYLNKTISISGAISELNTSEITIDNSIFCLFNNTISSTLKLKQNIKIKGRFIGYDDLLEQVKLDQCSIINN